MEYVAAKNGDHAYVALFNAADRRLEQAWTGMNDAGFAIMNTASYNLKDDKVSARKMDREGYVMTIALRTCRTVDDFARLLETLPRPMGVEANFGVIDATGNGAFSRPTTILSPDSTFQTLPTDSLSAPITAIQGGLAKDTGSSVKRMRSIFCVLMPSAGK